MTKKWAVTKSRNWAVTLVVLFEAAIYLFILLGLPALEAMTCPSCQAMSDFEPPIFLYVIPGLVGAFCIVVILLRKREES